MAWCLKINTLFLWTFQVGKALNSSQILKSYGFVIMWTLRELVCWCPAPLPWQARHIRLRTYREKLVTFALVYLSTVETKRSGQVRHTHLGIYREKLTTRAGKANGRYLAFQEKLHHHLLIRNHTEDSSSRRTSPPYSIRKNPNHCIPPQPPRQIYFISFLILFNMYCIKIPHFSFNLEFFFIYS